jgi:hypothetical protein
LTEPIFSIKRDNELISAGTHFWCEACLIARPIDDQSPDTRYCQGCYDFLLKEAEMLRETGSWRRPAWIPKPQTSPRKAGGAPAPIPRIMSTVAGKKFEVDKIQPSVAIETPTKRLSNKRGRKPKELPKDLIMKLASKGVGSKAIASKLRTDHDITVSYKTIQRILTD